MKTTALLHPLLPCLTLSGKQAAVWLAGCLMMMVLPAMAANGVNRLENISYSTLAGNRVQINLNFASLAQPPISFATENPARIVLDFPDTSLNVSERRLSVGVGAVQNMGTVQASERTRVVISLIRMVPYTIDTLDNRVVLSIENIDPALASGIQSIPAGEQNQISTALANAGRQRYGERGVHSRPFAAQAVQTARPLGPSLENIDFRRIPGESDAEPAGGKIIVSLTDPNVDITLNEQGNNIIVNFGNMALPEKYDRRLDVTDFATPVQFIDTSMSGTDVVMTIETLERSKPSAYQSGNTYVIEVRKPLIVKEESKKVDITEREYNGTPVSFRFQDIPVEAALKLLLVDVAGKNLVTSEAVKNAGTVSLLLKNVPWDQALDTILETQRLGMREVGNVAFIDTRVNMDAQEQQALEARQKIVELEPLRTEFIQINYSKAEDIRTLLRSNTNNSTTDGVSHNFLSARGSVSVDERTNKLIIRDTADQITEIRNLIAALDTPVRQVLIESRIVIADDGFSKSLGVKFGYSANYIDDNLGAVFGGKVGGDTKFARPTGFSSDNTTITAGGSGENFIVALPAEALGGNAPAAVGLAIGKIGSYLLQLELSALQLENRGEVISSPRVITSNQSKASILQGTEIAVPGIPAPNQAAQVQFKEALLKLDVTPQITPDDRIIMDLVVKKDAPSGNDGSISRREVTTQVLVDDGETVVLGGVFERNKSNSVQRIPLLSDLPLVGELFKRRTNRDSKQELLIFVTPKILKESS